MPDPISSTESALAAEQRGRVDRPVEVGRLPVPRRGVRLNARRCTGLSRPPRGWKLTTRRKWVGQPVVRGGGHDPGVLHSWPRTSRRPASSGRLLNHRALLLAVLHLGLVHVRSPVGQPLPDQRVDRPEHLPVLLVVRLDQLERPHVPAPRPGRPAPRRSRRPVVVTGRRAARPAASCSARSASPDIRWNPYSKPRAFSTTSNAAEILPTASTVASSAGRQMAPAASDRCRTAAARRSETGVAAGPVPQAAHASRFCSSSRAISHSTTPGAGEHQQALQRVRAATGLEQVRHPGGRRDDLVRRRRTATTDRPSRRPSGSG